MSRAGEAILLAGLKCLLTALIQFAKHFGRILVIRIMLQDELKLLSCPFDVACMSVD